jgi:glutaredoxin 3
MQPVRMYSTEWCPYCQRAKALLKQRGVESFEDIRLDVEPSLRAAMIQETGRYTVPQIFIGDTHVGGCDELMALDRRGALRPLLEGVDAVR